ncbi:diguanylate cyclase domain-containing protein [Psychromonas sp. KJ10-10]|uniref:diguanylate cyclase domain-containing protein n=1 Tax=Psychromonas sp. KJ10-10 TaxID=3391823 RepID=UPI0039B62D38
MLFEEINGTFLYAFDLPNHGIIIFETRVEFEPIIAKALQPIFVKLSTSCYSNIVYNSLLLEMEARKKADKRAIYEAQHDALTGLFSQQYIKELLKQDYVRAIQEKHHGCLIFLGLNRFKAINDEMGHSIGDKVLIALAQRLNALSCEHLNVARFGGDEFILLLSHLPQDMTKAQEIVDGIILKINHAINLPLTCEGNLFKIFCSIGYHFYPQQHFLKNVLLKMMTLKT